MPVFVYAHIQHTCWSIFFSFLFFSDINFKRLNLFSLIQNDQNLVYIVCFFTRVFVEFITISLFYFHIIFGVSTFQYLFIKFNGFCCLQYNISQLEHHEISQFLSCRQLKFKLFLTFCNSHFLTRTRTYQKIYVYID